VERHQPPLPARAPTCPNEAKPIKELLSKVMQTSFQNETKYGPHKKVYGIYRGWKVKTTDPSIYSRPLTPPEEKGKDDTRGDAIYQSSSEIYLHAG